LENTVCIRFRNHTAVEYIHFLFLIDNLEVFLNLFSEIFIYVLNEEINIFYLFIKIKQFVRKNQKMILKKKERYLKYKELNKSLLLLTEFFQETNVNTVGSFDRETEGS
jgi:hypothetical protein